MFPAIEVLFTSGYTQNAIVHGGRLDPGVELISKPYRRDELARKIRQLFAARKDRAPAIIEAPAAEAAEPLPANAAAPLSILVVEDNQDARTMLSELLLILGHSVEGVGSAEQALEVLAQNRAQKRFDVLLTDHSLPGMSGLELARAVAAKAEGMKIVFSSGYGAPETASLGFKPLFLPKPFTLAALQDVLDALSCGGGIQERSAH
jgi:CheY-like chemotaxis protein